MIKEWTDFIARCNVRPHVIFLVDYDMDLAEHLVHGVDLWLNTPRRPWEASGTSGMKVLVNGGLNLSELDGWWAEAYAPEVGWALGDGLEHDDDPAVDAAEAERLYDLLENEIIPEFYDRDAEGIPRRWIARVRESMARLTPAVLHQPDDAKTISSATTCPGAVAYRERAGRGAAELLAWRETPRRALERTELRRLRGRDGGRARGTDAPVPRSRISAGRVPADAFRVEVYAEPGEIHVLERDGGDAHGVFSYTASVPATDRPATTPPG